MKFNMSRRTIAILMAILAAVLYGISSPISKVLLTKIPPTLMAGLLYMGAGIGINHSMTYYPRRTDTYKCEFKVSLPKTDAGIRKLPIMQPVYDALQSEYERQKEDGFCSTVVDGMTGFIFTNRFDTIHNPSAVNRATCRILEAYNADEIVNAKKECTE